MDGLSYSLKGSLSSKLTGSLSNRLTDGLKYMRIEDCECIDTKLMAIIWVVSLIPLRTWANFISVVSKRIEIGI